MEFLVFRTTVSGRHPAGLAPGQIGANLADNMLYVGNGGNEGVLAGGKGNVTPKPPAGRGWVQRELLPTIHSSFYLS